MQRYIQEYREYFSIGIHNSNCHTIVYKSTSHEQEIEAYLSEKEKQLKEIENEKNNIQSIK